MKFILTLIILAISICGHAQCDKEIKTNPYAPVNDEFLPLKNNWYPGSPPYSVNSFLNSDINWYPPTSIVIDLGQNWSSPVGNGSGYYYMTNPYSSDHALNHLNGTPNAPNDDDYKDYRWEDGWELLWINLGMHFNGDPFDQPATGTYFATGNNGNPIYPEISPSNIPYFVIYNRYRGLLRLFANVWQDNLNPSFQEIAVTMSFADLDASLPNVSGIFRHASQYDKALDQATEVVQIMGPRIQPVNSSDWLVAEFEMAFDPCICMREFNGVQDPGRIEFVFETIETLNIDMMSRTIETINAIDSTNLNEDFLNLASIDPSVYKPGTVMYKRMEDMFDKYQADMTKYNLALADYMEAKNAAKYDFMATAKGVMNTGIEYFLPVIGNAITTFSSESLDPNIILPDSASSPGKFWEGIGKMFDSALKGVLGIGVDHASMELFPKAPSKPAKPTSPVASFSETFYKGTIQKTLYQRTAPLLIPGGVDGYSNDTVNFVGYGKLRLSPRIFPAYNKVLGTNALLKYKFPKIFVDSEFSSAPYAPVVSSDYYAKFDFRLRFDSLIAIALNRSLDIDFDKTQTYVNVEVILERFDYNTQSEIMSVETFTDSSNMNLTHALPDSTSMFTNAIELQFNSKWIPLEKLNQYIFSISHRDSIYTDALIQPNWYPNFDYKLKSIKFKLLHDMYFDQIGYWGKQVNTTHVNTYSLVDLGPGLIGNYFGYWDGDASGSGLHEYIPGELRISDVHLNDSHPYVREVMGNTLIVSAEDVVIDGFVDISSGYLGEIHALESIRLAPGAVLSPQISLSIKKDFQDVPVFDYVSNESVFQFCNQNRGYQANTLAASVAKQISNSVENGGEINENLNDEDRQEYLECYPNPTSQSLNLFSSFTGESILKIFDLSGRILFDESLYSSGSLSYQFDISTFQSGVYIVQVENSGKIIREKVLVVK